MSLVSATEMAALRAVALSGMQTPVVVKRHTLVETDYGSEDTWATVAEVDGWITEQTTNGAVLGEVGGVQSLAAIYRLFLPVGTDIEADDQVLAAGQTFIVQHSNAESTYLPMLTVALRRAE